MKRLGMLLVLIVLLLVPVPVQAGMIANIGGTIVAGNLVGGTNYLDNQAGVDVNPAIGIMDIGAFLNGVSLNFVIQGFTATSGNPLASLTLNTNSNLTRSAPLPLSIDIFISDIGYTSQFPRLTQTVNLLSSTGGITGNATADGYYGLSNTNFDVNGRDTGFALAAVAAGIGTNVPAFSGGFLSTPVPYSLTTAVHLNITGRGTDAIQNLQLNANLSAIATPEPGTWMMIAPGLGLCLISRKFLRRY